MPIIRAAPVKISTDGDHCNLVCKFYDIESGYLVPHCNLFGTMLAASHDREFAGYRCEVCMSSEVLDAT